MATINTGKNDKLKVSGDASNGWIAHNILTKDDLTDIGDANPLPVELKNCVVQPGQLTPPNPDGGTDFVNTNSVISLLSFQEGASSRTGAWYPTCEILLDSEHRIPINTMPISCDGEQSNVGSGKSLAFSQATIGTSAQVVSSDGTTGTGKRGCTIRNNGAQSVYVGDVGVSTSNGYLLLQNESITINTMAAIYCRCAASTTVVSVIEF